MFKLLSRPVAIQKPVPTPVEIPSDQMSEYVSLCHKLNITTAVGHSRLLLRTLKTLDLPIYDLKTVVAYMDKIAKRDGNGHGWLWRPVRYQDHTHLSSITFGTSSERYYRGRMPASDFYDGSHRIHTYDKPIPMHALERIHAITKVVTDKDLAFMVSDYATKDDKMQPDPFLMVVITATLEAPRYVIDFWDEPGFGLNEMLR